MKNIRLSIKEFGYIILLILAFMTNTTGKFFLSQQVGFLILALIVIWALVIYFINGCRIKNPLKRIVIPVFFKYNLLIKVIMHFYVIALILLGLTESRFLSTNLITYVNALSAIAVVYLVGDRAWIVSTIALIITWIVSIAWAIFTYGLLFVNHIEFNDLAFATGYLFLYYIVFKKKWTKADLIYLTFAILIITITAKRIGIAGLFFAIIIHFIINLCKNNKRKKYMINLVSICYLFGLYLFIYLIIKGTFFEFIELHISDSIHFLMGRNYYWKVLAELCDFSPAFIGFGRNASATLFTNEYSYMHVGNVHSDILKNYMESGFILFGLWFLNYFKFFRDKIEKKIGFNAMYIYFIMSVYTFFVYITDNTETYLITQFFYMLIPLLYSLQSVRKNQVNHVK